MIWPTATLEGRHSSYTSSKTVTEPRVSFPLVTLSQGHFSEMPLLYQKASGCMETLSPVCGGLSCLGDSKISVECAGFCPVEPATQKPTASTSYYPPYAIFCPVSWTLIRFYFCFSWLKENINLTEESLFLYLVSGLRIHYVALRRALIHMTSNTPTWDHRREPHLCFIYIQFLRCCLLCSLGCCP